MATMTNPVANRYYPRLSELMTVDDLPEFLSFIQNGLDDLLESIYYPCSRGLAVCGCA